MTKLNNIMKSLIMVFLALIISACSSGSSTTLTSLNLTGTWVGTIQDTPSLAFDVRIIILQDNTPFTGNSTKIPVSYSVTFSNPSDGSSTDCAETINNLEAELRFGSNVAFLDGEEINAIANNATISGQAVFSNTCGGPINLTRI